MARWVVLFLDLQRDFLAAGDVDLPFHLSNEDVPRLAVVTPPVPAGADEVGGDRPVLFFVLLISIRSPQKAQ